MKRFSASLNSDYTCDVDISEDGKIKDIPIGGIPIPTTVQAACVNGVLLTGTSGSEVVTVGFARKPTFAAMVQDFKN